jgi:hypothetical protein
MSVGYGIILHAGDRVDRKGAVRGRRCVARSPAELKPSTAATRLRGLSVQRSLRQPPRTA